MNADPFYTAHDFILFDSEYYLELIRGDSPASFTRYRVVSITDIIYQMLDRKGRSQWSDIMDFYDDLGKKQNITETGFYLARKKFNPEAMRVMSNDFIAKIYDDNSDGLKRWNGNLLLAVDGSRTILPDTKENETTFGRINVKPSASNFKEKPVGGLLSTLYDCLNDVYLDMQFGPCDSSEQEYASQHINTFGANYNEKAIFVFDRGYPSLKLLDQLTLANQSYLFRLPSIFLKSYTSQVNDGEDKVMDISLDSLATNYYRKDIQLRQRLMNTTYSVRFTKLIIGKSADGEDIVELLMSNLPIEKYSMEDLKDLYHLRWTIETSYNRLKNRMKLEEFSGYKPILIYQDIYSDIWLYNLISLKLTYMNELKPIEQQKDGRYECRRNFNKAVGIMKKQFIKSLVMMDKEVSNEALNIIEENLMCNVIWIKKDRTYERKKTSTPSSMSYKKTY